MDELTCPEPFAFAQDRPFDFAQDRPFDFAQDRPFDSACTEWTPSDNEVAIEVLRKGPSVNSGRYIRILRRAPGAGSSF